jgi:TrmH family RNA methyltransferase
MITSLSNERVKTVRGLQARRRTREQEGRFVLEGVRLVGELARTAVRPDFVLYTQTVASEERSSALLAAFQQIDIPCCAVSEAVMAACSDTETPQGVLAVVPVPKLARPQNLTLALIVDGVRDPGNLGTMLRTAWAAAVDLVLLAPGTVDATNPKVVRAGMGAHLHLPIRACDWDAIRAETSGLDVWLASAAGQIPYSAVEWRRPAGLIAGGEAEGAGAEAHALARGTVAIPMAPGVESLNTAIATAVVLFEVVRQRMSATA